MANFYPRAIHCPAEGQELNATLHGVAGRDNSGQCESF